MRNKLKSFLWSSLSKIKPKLTVRHSVWKSIQHFKVFLFFVHLFSTTMQRQHSLSEDIRKQCQPGDLKQFGKSASHGKVRIFFDWMLLVVITHCISAVDDFKLNLTPNFSFQNEFSQIHFLLVWEFKQFEVNWTDFIH